MTVMAGLRRQGVFDRMGRALLALSGGTLQLVLVLVGLCFFGSMFITNDVSLLTFVPFTFVVLDSLGDNLREKTGPAGGLHADGGGQPGQHADPHRQPPEPLPLRPGRPGGWGSSCC